ncbi:unnamed protein product [Urochloa humidicola]
MERFAAMVSSRRSAADPAPAPGEGVAEGNGKRKLTAADEAYLRIQLEEIVVVKNEDVTRLAAACGNSNSSSLSGGARACAPGAAVAAPAPAGISAAAAARGAVSTTVGWIAGSN